MADTAGDEGLSDLVSRLADDAKAYASAEAAVYREIVSARFAAGRGGAIMLILALFLISAAATALVVGMLLIATRYVGPIWATVIVVLTTLAIAGLLGFLGLGKVMRAWRGPA